MGRASRIRRELAEFPYGKLEPLDFRLEIAGAEKRDLENRLIRVWVELADVRKVLKVAGFARVIEKFPHINFVYVETYASELGFLVASDLVRSVWNDLPVKADGCALAETDSRSRTLAVRPDGLAREGRPSWDGR
jgi:hypothetical protein